MKVGFNVFSPLLLGQAIYLCNTHIHRHAYIYTYTIHTDIYTQVYTYRKELCYTR